jgi:hypothetical protein
MHRSKFAWNDYFSGTQALTLSSAQYDSRQTPSESNIYVLNCLFNNCNSASRGSALYITSTTYLLVELTSFFSCKTGGNGGAIYFYNSGNGQCVLYGVCGYDCCTTGTSSCLFVHIYLSDSPSSKNYVNYSSIVRCVNENSHTHYMLYLYYGKILCPSVNSSTSKCNYFAGIYCAPTVDSSSVACSLSYSSFVNNNAFGYMCIGLDRPDALYEIKSCNILRNTQGSLGTDGLIHISGNVMVDDSCILENKATYIFYVTSSSYAVILSNCYADSTSCNQNLFILTTVTKGFIHGLQHISTQNCHSEYDSAGTLTVIPYVSHANKLFCYTCNQHQVKISDFFSLIWVFIVTFIHPKPSEDCL